MKETFTYEIKLSVRELGGEFSKEEKILQESPKSFTDKEILMMTKDTIQEFLPERLAFKSYRSPLNVILWLFVILLCIAIYVLY